MPTKKLPAKKRTLPKFAPKAAQAPFIREKKQTKKKVTAADLVEIHDTNLILSIDLKRQSDETIYGVEIEENQRLFPYNVLSRLLVGWQVVGFISSFEVKLSSDRVLPEVTVRFMEKMSSEDAAKMDSNLKAQVMTNVNLVRQYPFIKVECPLLTTES